MVCGVSISPFRSISNYESESDVSRVRRLNTRKVVDRAGLGNSGDFTEGGRELSRRKTLTFFIEGHLKRRSLSVDRVVCVVMMMGSVGVLMIEGAFPSISWTTRCKLRPRSPADVDEEV
jgi:hypothetical protein